MGSARFSSTLSDSMRPCVLCYEKKGDWLDRRAHIELLPSGDVIKSLMDDPWQPSAKTEHRVQLQREAEVYKVLGNGNPHIPKLVAWEPDSCCLTVQHFQNGDLSRYVSGKMTSGCYDQVSLETRQRWATQAAQALQSVHDKNVVHCDVAPRNFLLDGDLNLVICDFTASVIFGTGSEWTVCPDVGYSRPGLAWKEEAQKVDDIFLLGSVIYYIMQGRKVFPDVTEEAEAERRFRAKEFPNMENLPFAEIIRGCWEGTLPTEETVVAAICDEWCMIEHI